MFTDLLDFLRLSPAAANLLLISVAAFSGILVLAMLIVGRLTFRDIYKFLASLQFAIVLLSVIIIATAVGTWYESQFNADVAQKHIYSHWWFNVWLGALCVNLFCVAAIRFPWKRHQTGFVITHAGIITLLVGAMIDRMWGIEGFMHLHTTKQGTNVMELHQQDLSATIDGKSAHNYIKVNTIFNPQPLESPLPDVKIGISNVLPVQATEVALPAEPGDTNTKPGLNLTLQGSMMGRNDMSIFLGESEDLRMAKILFIKGMPVLAPTKENYKDDGADLLLDFEGKAFKFQMKFGEQKELALDGFPGWKIQLKGYYPNFIMGPNKLPTTRDPNDLRPIFPAAHFELVGPPVKGANIQGDPHAQAGPGQATPPQQDTNLVAPQNERFFVYASDNPMMAVPIHGPATGASATLVPRMPVTSSSLFRGPNGLAIFFGPDGKLRYYIKARDRSAQVAEGDEPKSIERTGEVELEKPVAVGWGAPGSEFVVHDFIQNAQRKVVFLPKPDMKKDEEGANQGVECEVCVPTANVTGYMFPTADTVTIMVPSHDFVVGQTISVSLNSSNRNVDGFGKIIETTPASITYIKQNKGSGSKTGIAGTVGEAKRLWVGQTEVDKAFPQELTVHGRKVNFKFVNQCVTIPFTVKLKQFRAPTDEGSNEFAAFQSDLLFKNMECAVTLKKDFYLCVSPTDGTAVKVSQSYTDPIHYNRDGRIVLDGEWRGPYKPEVTRYNFDEYMSRVVPFKAGNEIYSIQMNAVENVIFKNREVEQTISMNRPCTFPMTWYGPWMGICYKFSQASHHILPNDPEHSDPNYSGVQVLRDPGWLLKWVGCVMICFGIFTMFYLRPYFNRPKVAVATGPKPGSETESDAGAKKKKRK